MKRCSTQKFPSPLHTFLQQHPIISCCRHGSIAKAQGGCRLTCDTPHANCDGKTRKRRAATHLGSVRFAGPTGLPPTMRALSPLTDGRRGDDKRIV